jgi:ribonuclease P protein component
LAPTPSEPAAQADLRFPKRERLKSKKLLDLAFAHGGEKPLKAWPILMKIVPTDLPEKVPTQTAFSAAKRKFPRAVDRNAIKRQMREAWRHERGPLESALRDHGVQWAIVLIFVGQEIPDADRCRKAMGKLVGKALAALEKGNQPKETSKVR